jgi:type III secretory pathway component EscT
MKLTSCEIRLFQQSFFVQEMRVAVGIEFVLQLEQILPLFPGQKLLSHTFQNSIVLRFQNLVTPETVTQRKISHNRHPSIVFLS